MHIEDTTHVGEFHLYDVDTLTAGAAYIRVFIFIGTLGLCTTFRTC